MGGNIWVGKPQILWGLCSVIISKHVEVVPPFKKLLNNFHKNLRKTTVWQISKKIHNKNSCLTNCLFFVQIHEVA
jgi:hypothetical protein